jgi:formate hydrogenlyase subunit 3/multisubunit Na+/H+ antiporter MnhD subunit
MNYYLLMLGWIPVFAGLTLLFTPDKWKKLSISFSLIVSLLVFYYQIHVFLVRPELGLHFAIDNLNAFILLFVGLFTILSLIYSSSYFRHPITRFCAYILLTLGVSNLTLLTTNLLIFLILWGFLGITLYVMINFASPSAAQASKKTFIIVGGADAFLLLGIAILWKFTGSFEFSQISTYLANHPTSQLSSWLTVSFLCIMLASFAKAGAFPVHTWIPEISETTSIPVMAYLPASMDKLLGIYLLARITLDIFRLSPQHILAQLLVIIGAFTIISAVMMALIQHNLRKLLAYHAVSQVGYMVLGIGTLNPIGFIGGLFHMLNHAIYKSCLFLSAGNVEKETQTLELSKLGGLSRVMPWTFLGMLISALSISGVPPFNGFYSKWMVYQGVIVGFSSPQFSFFEKLIYMLALTAAVVGSALTLASFLKVLYGVFLGQKSEFVDKVKEVGKMLLFPVIVLSILCIVFGIFAQPLVLKYLINPLKLDKQLGIWSPGLATVLILISLFLGLLSFVVTKIKFRTAETFIGGEKLGEELRPRADEFYNDIREFPIIAGIYRWAERKLFDIYELGLKITFVFIRFLRYLHNGVLPTYLVWCLIGMLVLFLKLVR